MNLFTTDVTNIDKKYLFLRKDTKEKIIKAQVTAGPVPGKKQSDSNARHCLRVAAWCNNKVAYKIG